MTNIKYWKKLFFLFAMGFSLCAVQACSSDDDDTMEDGTTEDAANDYGKITGNNFVATGGYRDVKPLRATILASINSVYQGAYSSLGVEFAPNQPDFNSSATRRVSSNSGVTDGHFETHLTENGEGLLEPGTTYYYRAYVNIGGTRYNGETRSFVTPDLKLSEGKLVDLGLSVKWASCNMGANAPETAGTSPQQYYAFWYFNGWPNDLRIYRSLGEEIPIPEDVNDGNWLGNSNYDVATRTMGSGYRIPTEEEWQELEYGCRWTAGVCNGVKGFYICDKANGTGVIFLPHVKKSNQDGLTVYLSAPDNIVWSLRRAFRLHEEYIEDMSQAPNSDKKLVIMEDFYNERDNIDQGIRVGEVLTENSHIYCYHDGPALDKVYKGKHTWTHPKTGKEYEYTSQVHGAGILYVRAVGNK